MKRVKILILLFMVLVLSGCNINYDVNIKASKNDKNQVLEEIIFNFDNSEISVNNISNYVTETFKNYQNLGMLKDYKLKKDIGKKNSKIIIYKKYSSLEEYVNSNEALQYAFKNVNYIDNYGDKGLNTTDKYIGQEIFNNEVSENIIDNIKITYHFQNEILENNADIYDKSNNTLTWNLDKTRKDANITFQYSNSKKYDIIIKDYIKQNYIYLLLLVGIIVAAIVSIYLIRKKSFLSNEI